MSYFPKKGMWRDDMGVARFDDPGIAPEPGCAKRWFLVEVLHRKFNGDGEVIWSKKHRDLVFATEKTLTGIACSRNPPPNDVQDVKTSIHYHTQRSGDTFPSLY